MKTKKKEILDTVFYLAIVFLFSGIIEWLIFSHRASESIGTLILMWTPGICAIISCLILGYPLRDLAVRCFKLKYLAISYVIPVIVGILQLGLLIIFRIETFSIDSKVLESYGNLNNFLIATLVISPTYYVLISSLYGIGEELGWRGFLHSRLTHLKIKYRDLWIGFIWGVWHWPLLIWLDYSAFGVSLWSMCLFMISVIALSVFMGWLRDSSNSVVPNGISHGVHNIWLQGIIPLFLKPGRLSPYLSGETGLFVALLYVIIATILYKWRTIQKIVHSL